MEYAKDISAGLRDRYNAGAHAVPSTRCDWHSLSVRLQAAHAARIELDRAQVNHCVPGGSFVSTAGNHYPDTNHGSQTVNPSALGDGKAVCDTVALAGAIRRGDGRG